MLLIFSVLLFASSLAKILTQFIVKDLNINIFSSNFSAAIPFFSTQLGMDKTFDLLNFWIVLALVVIYG